MREEPGVGSDNFRKLYDIFNHLLNLLQVWMASFLLCDFIMANSSLFTDQHILELGSGTGITSILLASTNVVGIFCTGRYTSKVSE